MLRKTTVHYFLSPPTQAIATCDKPKP
ncbi:hypothetical protein AWR26_24715 [Kosakonia oryzae]|uniref:Uncharacterized protein n=1 Tax=Kosakonia oryzae TaxID=497725 RepID=A0ABX7PYH7_9ENTR|nr:hypothetical protein AWR26_24715 [Kosakonia oryzae]